MYQFSLPILFTLLCAGCSGTQSSTQTNPMPAQNNTTAFDLQGHRGCRGLMPENTWPAMRLALDLNVTTLEMDVVITKDKQVVLSHEPWFGHEITTKPDGSFVTEKEEKSLNIYRMNYEEVKRFDVGLKPHPRFPKQQKMGAVKPRLADVLDSVQQYMRSARRAFPYFNIEIKSLPEGDGVFHPAPKEFVELVVKVIGEKGLTDQCIIQSFDLRPLQYLHQHYPSVKTALLIEDFDKKSFEEQLKLLGFTPAIYSPHYSLVTPELLAQCRSKNIRLIPWTVNDAQKMKELKAMGVDGLITDYPDLWQQ